MEAKGDHSLNYLTKRLLLMIPTLLGITLINFTILQLAPGGPIESLIARIRYSGVQTMSKASSVDQSYVSEDVILQLKKKYGFDKPLWKRYLIWLKNLIHLDFGESHIYGKKVIDVILSKVKVSFTYGALSLVITYFICIPWAYLNVLVPRTQGISSFILFFFYSIPSYILGIILIIIFASGQYFSFFPMSGWMSLGLEDASSWEQFKDISWHLILPLICLTIHQLAALTLLFKRALLQEGPKAYIITAQAKGYSYEEAMIKHGFRNAFMILLPSFSGLILSFLGSNVLIEKLFNLDGLGKLFYDAALDRDYPLIMAQIVLSTLILLVVQLIIDFLYSWLDPRIRLGKS